MKGSLAGLESHRRLHPHPRVTAVAKRAQPPRRLPSPATRARDLQKKALAVFCSKRARDLEGGVEQGEPLHYRARGDAKLSQAGTPAWQKRLCPSVLIASSIRPNPGPFPKGKGSKGKRGLS